MTEIDNKKMWESMLRRAKFIKDRTLCNFMICSLRDQDFTVNNDGEIVSIEPEIKWYKCIKEYSGFIVGKLYQVNEYGDLESEPSCPYSIYIKNPYFDEWFRPATEEEIKQHKIVKKELGYIKGYREKAINMLKELEQEQKQSPCDTCTNGSGGCAMTCNFEKQEHSDGELTEFENRLGEILIPSWDITKGCSGCECTVTDVKNYAKELLSIANKQLQPKQEWSEEDKEIIESLIDRIERRRMSSVGSESAICEKQINFLKSLRSRNNTYHEGFKNGFAKARDMGYKQWKPSEEQMRRLKEACDEHWEPDGLDPLYTLYEQLKAL